jgi:nucleotide-binding universal stress UspA family protein
MAVSRILLGLADAQSAQATTQTAIAIAQRHQAEITAVTVVDLAKLRDVGAVPPGAGQAAKELREHRLALTRERVEQAIDDFQSQCQAQGVAYQILQEEHDEPYDFLISQSRYHDLTVLSLRGIFDYPIGDDLQEDTSLTLVRLISEGVRPILAVPAKARTPRRVFAAYSGSVASAATIRNFLQLQPFANIELQIATFEMDAARSQHLLEEIAKYCRPHHIEPQLTHYPESPRDHLLREAKNWQADLIVLGNSAKNLLLRRMLGETALQAIREAEVPLFLAQ